MEHTDSTLDSDTPTTPRASRMKRRLTMSESDRPKITPAPANILNKAKSTRSKVGTSSHRPHFKDDPTLKDLFVAPMTRNYPLFRTINVLDALQIPLQQDRSLRTESSKCSRPQIQESKDKSNPCEHQTSDLRAGPRFNR